MKLHNDTQCDVSHTSVYRQRRAVGVGCLVGVLADREPLGSSRDYSFVLGSGEADCDIVEPMSVVRAVTREKETIDGIRD